MKKRIVSLFALAITGVVCLTLYSLGDIHLVMEIMGIEQYEETIHAKEDIKTTIVLDLSLIHICFFNADTGKV